MNPGGRINTSQKYVGALDDRGRAGSGHRSGIGCRAAGGDASLADIIDDIAGRELGGITIAGHTDTSGTADDNLQLSERRASTVATELVRAGVPAQIITAEGFGQNDLAVATKDGVVLAANRRVVIDFAR